MPKFRKKPVVIDAVQWTGKNVHEVYTFLHGAPTLTHDIARDKWCDFERIHAGKDWHIKTLEDGPNGEAKHVASVGDWIIKGVQGEFYPCKPDIFAATYEPALSAALAVEAGAEIDGGRFADWSTSMIAAECRAQSRDQLDPEFSRFMGEVAKRLSALTPASSDLSNAPVAFGLEAQGHIPTIETMLAEGADWQEIGRAILWDGDTAKSYYERYLARRTPASSAVEGEAVSITRRTVERPPLIIEDEPAPTPAGEWRTMDSAPKDGKHCILAVPSGSGFIYSIQGAFMNGKWMNAADIDAEPLYWMPNVPLPASRAPHQEGRADV